MLRHVGLDEHRAAIRIEPSCEPVQQHFYRVLLDFGGIGVVGGECMPVGDEEKTVVLVLHANPIVERADVVAQMQPAGRAHTAQHAFTMIGTWGHQITVASAMKNASTGEISAPNNPLPK